MAALGYCRTSTADQVAGLEAQQRDLLAAGCDSLFSEQISSLAASRPELTRLLAALQPGDTLVVCKPDRLARSTVDLLRIVDDLRTRRIGLRILSMGLSTLDQGNPTTMLMLSILASVAQFERSIMLERQREGIIKAQADGKYRAVGSRSPTPQHIIDSVRRLVAEKKSNDEIMVALGIKRDMLFRVKRKLKAGGNSQLLSTDAACAA